MFFYSCDIDSCVPNTIFYHLPTFSIPLFCSLIPIPFLCFRTLLGFTILYSKQALNGGTRIEIVWFRYVQDDRTFEDQLPHTYTCGQGRTQYVDMVVHYNLRKMHGRYLNYLLVPRLVLQLKNLSAGYWIFHSCSSPVQLLPPGPSSRRGTTNLDSSLGHFVENPPPKQGSLLIHLPWIHRLSYMTEMGCSEYNFAS
jgi:hypothetical protein